MLDVELLLDFVEIDIWSVIDECEHKLKQKGEIDTSLKMNGKNTPCNGSETASGSVQYICTPKTLAQSHSRSA
jgi:hypothetical protein